MSTENIMGILEAGIRAENLRHKAIANNVANIETPGYRRLDIKFEELLAKALLTSEEIDLDDVEPELYRPELNPVKSNGNDVTLEEEVGALIKNALNYKAYVRLLNNKYKQIDMAMNFSR